VKRWICVLPSQWKERSVWTQMLDGLVGCLGAIEIVLRRFLKAKLYTLPLFLPGQL
jgi:hypothetical protein